MKKRSIIIIACALLVVIGAVFMMNKAGGYNSAYEKTNKLKNFQMTLDTIVTISDSENLLQRTTEQTLDVEGRGSDKLIYEINTVASMTNSETGSYATEESSMIYYDSFAYQNLAGLKYCVNVTEKTGEENLENFINTIAFPFEKMKNVEEEKENGGILYTYTVDFEDVSDNVKGSLQEAINDAGGTFKADSMVATAFVKDGYVKERSLCVTYINESSVTVSVEIYAELTQTSAKVAKPDKSEYLTM